jgi:TatA/E family protein of Tat protein translocase
VLAIILDSLGNTELLFILVIALVFFGPRKLPQLARSMGKSLAEFRKASEDFKRTWEREVALETVRAESAENSIMGEEFVGPGDDGRTIDVPLIEPVQPELAVPRQNSNQHSDETSSTAIAASSETDSKETPRKRDWL